MINVLSGPILQSKMHCVDVLLGKCDEFKIPVWTASLNMQKAFDRVEHVTIFQALRYFEVEESLIVLVQLLYEHQSGTIDEKYYFSISRGIRQDDILSILLFNAILNFAFEK